MKHLQQIIDATRGAQVLATFAENERIVLKHLSSLETVRHWYSQMACLIGGNAMRCLKDIPSAPRSVVLGEWKNHLGSEQPAESPEALFELAAQSPNDASASVGLLAARLSWPRGTDAHLSGMKAMVKGMDELGNIAFGRSYKPSVQVGGSVETSVRKRVQEGIVVAKRAGYTPYQEEALTAFLDVLVTARFLHVCHEVRLP